jgi:SHS2 domain-containing protein
MGGFRLVAHTADMGIEATAITLGDVFIEAARGLRSMIFGEALIAATRDMPIEVHGADRCELLVGWLSEILYLFEVKGLAPADFVVEEITDGALRGKVQGETFDPSRHPVEREVKAVTYHQVSVEKETSGWRARVYVDL